VTILSNEPKSFLICSAKAPAGALPPSLGESICQNMA
jgi:hypothetical protein